MLKRFFTTCTAFFLLALSLSLAPAAAADEKQLFSFPFEDESAQGQYFTVGDSASLEWATGFGHDDSSALKVTHIPDTTYTSSSNAVVLTLPEPLPTGGVYRVVAWVYAASEDNANKGTLTGPGFVLNGDYGGSQGVVKFPPDFGTLPLDEWMCIDVTLPIHDEPISRLDFRIVINDEPKHPDVWYWDNIEISQVGELEEVSASEEEYPVVKRSKIATYDDFDYELWSQNGTDSFSMTLTGGGTFQCIWDARNVLFRMGKKMGSTMTYGEYGDIIMEYAAEHTITRGDVSYLCVYGWTEDPMIEFYIIESHGNYKPPGGVGYKGSYSLDGGTYEVYVDTRVDQPSIQGTKTFQQYFAVRTEKRTEGTITISEHFKAWEGMRLDMSGKMYEVALCVEGYNGGGKANIYNHVLTIGDTQYGTPSQGLAEFLEAEEAPEPPAPSPGVIETPEETTPSPASESPGETPDDLPEQEESGFPILWVIIGVVIIGAGAVLLIMKNK